MICGKFKGGHIWIETPSLEVVAGTKLQGTIYVNQLQAFKTSALSLHLIGFEETNFMMGDQK